MHEVAATVTSTTASSNSVAENPLQITYNLSNCFPKSYTEYYHQQQNHQQQPHQLQQQQIKSNNTAASNAQLLNAIEQHDYPAYAVVERNNTNGLNNSGSKNKNSNFMNTNPFLAASNFKQFDSEVLGACNNAGGSMQRSKRKALHEKTDDKKFYSLKFPGVGGKSQKSLAQKNALNHTMIDAGSNAAAGSSSASKCKRHHSFAGGSIGDINSQGPLLMQQQQSQQVPTHLLGNGNLALSKTAMHFYDPPVYENLSDSVQIHECEMENEAGGGSAAVAATTVLLHSQPSSQLIATTGPKKKHHHRQHQQKDDFNLIEPERLSIYRSDSGISNSSYECVPTASAMGSGNSATPKASTKPNKSQKSSNVALTTATNKKSSSSTCRSNINSQQQHPPVYMNVEGQLIEQQRSSSPMSASTLVNSSYESTSSSQNDGTANTDPTSMSSCNSLYSSGTGTLIAGSTGKPASSAARHCQRHIQKGSELTTPEEFEQYQLGHHNHSASSLSVASNQSAASSRANKCKKANRPNPSANEVSFLFV